jgi:hypothetical protein
MTRITVHPGNEVRCRHAEENLEKPQKLWSGDCRASRCTAVKDSFYLTPLDFESTSKIISLRIQGESLGHVGAKDLWTCPELSPGQVPFQRQIIPGSLPPSLYHQEVTSADIWRQMRKVKKARKRLVEALKADSLSREAE